MVYLWPRQAERGPEAVVSLPAATAPARPAASPPSQPAEAAPPSGERAAKPLSQVEAGWFARSPKQSFQECEHCPQMVVVPAGSFTMGSPENEPERDSDEGPQHEVRIPKPFAVGKFTVTFDEWAACAPGAAARALLTPSDQGWGKRKRPVINVSWNDATGICLLAEREGWGRALPAAFGGGMGICGAGGHQTRLFLGATAYRPRSRRQFSKVFGAALGIQSRLARSAANAFGLYDMSAAMSGNGRRIAGTRITIMHPPMARHGLPEIVAGGFFAAVPGTAFLRTSARRTASGTPRTTVTTISVSA